VKQKKGKYQLQGDGNGDQLLRLLALKRYIFSFELVEKFLCIVNTKINSSTE
jgi:hypothetical protein